MRPFLALLGATSIVVIAHAAVSPLSQTVNEGTTALWAGDVELVQSSNGDPVSIAWDFDGDGVADSTLCDNTLGGLPSCTLEHCAGPFWASAASAFPTGDKPIGAAIADFNNDGANDVVTANSGEATVSVLLGANDGTFGPPTDYSTGGIISAYFVHAADLNEDGNADVIAGRQDVVAVFLGNGDGTLAPFTPYPAGSGACITGAAVAYVNTDSTLDMVVSNMCSWTVSVFLGDGDGTFTLQGNYDTGRQPRDITVADFDEDGNIDVATADAGETHFVSILLGSPNGALGAHYEVMAGSLTEAVASTDLNEDGHADLVVGNDGSGTISILLGNGNGTFAPDVEYPVGAPTWIRTADINGDLHQDIIASQGTFSIVVYPGRGDGTIGAGISFPTEHPSDNFTVADVNSDGPLDLIAVRRNVFEGSILVRLGRAGLWSCPVAASHAYFDSKGSGAGPSSTHDATLLVATTSSGTLEFLRAVVVQNVAPANLGIAASPAITEGGALTATFDGCDPGTNDVVTLSVAWGDGTTTMQTLAAPCADATLSHTYFDAGTYEVSSTFMDDEGGTSGTATHNVDVVDSLPSVSAVHSSDVVPIGQPAHVWVDIDSPAEANVFDFSWDGDGNFDGPNDVLGASSPASSFTSTVPLTLSVAVRVRDDDGNSAAGSIDVEWRAPPAMPMIQSPATGSIIDTAMPILVLGSADDYDFAEFEISVSPLFDSPDDELSGDVSPIGGMGAWSPEALVENVTYFWRARHVSGFGTSDWAVGTFSVDVVNSPPTSPLIVAPDDIEVDPAGGVDLVVVNSNDVDPGPSNLRYFFALARDPDGSDVIETSTEIPEMAGATFWTPSEALEAGTTYYWTVIAIDEDGASSSPSTAEFQTATSGGGGGGCALDPTSDRSVGPVLALVLAGIVFARRKRS